ncbi:hypothetical protein D3C73_1011050 [compost metagenome]
MPVEAVQREIHLAQRRLADNLRTRLMDQRAVGRDIDLEAFGMRGIQQLADLRMQQRLTFNM